MQTFEINLSLVLAHSVVCESKDTHSPNGVVDDARAGGDPPAQPAQETTKQAIGSYVKQYPNLINATAKGILPYETAKVSAAEQLLPRYSDLAGGITNAISGADLTSLQGNGGNVVRAANDLNHEVDPEYYASRANSSASLDKLINSIDLSGGLSPTEREEISRGVNRSSLASGNFGNGSATSSVANAMQFGQAGHDRVEQNRSDLSKALANAATLIPTFRSGVDPFKEATGKSSMGDFGASQMGQSTQGLSNSLLNNTFGAASQTNQINADRRDNLDRVNETMSSMPSYSG